MERCVAAYTVDLVTDFSVHVVGRSVERVDTDLDPIEPHLPEAIVGEQPYGIRAWMRHVGVASRP